MAPRDTSNNGPTMFLKCATAIILAALTGAMLLGLRQQRFETMHNMAKLHSGMNATRQTLWNLQTRVAGQIQPARLQDAITAANLPFETFTPSAPVQPQVVSNQQNLGMNLLKTKPSDIDLADGQPALDTHATTTINKTTRPGAANKTVVPTTVKRNGSIAASHTHDNSPVPGRLALAHTTLNRANNR